MTNFDSADDPDRRLAGRGLVHASVRAGGGIGRSERPPEVFPLAPIAGRLRADLNRAFLRREAKRHRRVLLVPQPPAGCAGSPAHYYHFLFDLVMPLSRVVGKGIPPGVFHLHAFGPLTAAFRDVFGDTVEVLPESADAPGARRLHLLGMNPRCVLCTSRALDGFRRFVLERLSIRDDREPDTVVLVERVRPDPYYLEVAARGGAGTSRRALVNHDELRDWMSGAVQPSYRFVNLQLETMPLRAQVEAFTRAALVVGQHGAGLANLVWAARGQTVVELDDVVRDNFALLARARGARFLRYGLASAHAVVDLPHFRDWVAGQPALGRFLR